MNAHMDRQSVLISSETDFFVEVTLFKINVSLIVCPKASTWTYFGPVHNRRFRAARARALSGLRVMLWGTNPSGVTGRLVQLEGEL